MDIRVLDSIQPLLGMGTSPTAPSDFTIVHTTSGCVLLHVAGRTTFTYSVPVSASICFLVLHRNRSMSVVSLVHPGGVAELYLGQVKGPRIDLATDAVMRTAGAKDYAAATRLYGLVDGHLLWAWDIAALGQDLRTHASARLAKVD